MRPRSKEPCASGAFTLSLSDGSNTIIEPDLVIACALTVCGNDFQLLPTDSSYFVTQEV